METAYREYLESDDKIVRIDGRVFHKVIFKDALNLEDIGQKYLVATVPNKLEAGEGSVLVDERLEGFTVNGIELYSFHSSVPEWHLETTPLVFKDLNPEDMGDFLALKEPEAGR